MAQVKASMGNTFQSWAPALAGMLTHRLYVDNVAPRQINNKISVIAEQPAVTTEDGPIRLDVSCRFKGVDLIAECKWSYANPVEQFEAAYSYLRNVRDANQHRLIMVGSPNATLDRTAVQTYAAKHERASELEYAYQATTGTNVSQFRVGTRRLIVVVLVSHEALEHELGRALALLLTRPPEYELGLTELAPDRLASACMVPLLRSLLDVPTYRSTGLDYSKRFEEAKVPNAFVRDPWSFLAERYLDRQRRRTPHKHRWIRLLHAAVASRAVRPDRLNEEQLAARTSPLPLRCGRIRDGEVVRELEDAILRVSRQGTSLSRSPVIRIVRGPAGTGKSTLLEFLYNNHLDRLWHGGGASSHAGLPVFIDLQRDSAALQNLSKEGLAPGDAAVLAMEKFTDCADRSIWRIPGAGNWKSPSAESILGALFDHFQLFVYIDGYDQLSSSEKPLLKAFGTALSEYGCEIDYLVLSSRPASDELLAFDWTTTFRNATPPGAESTLSLAIPEPEDVLIYCQHWLDELKAVLPHDVEVKVTDRLKAEAFLQWLNAPVGAERSEDVNADAIQSNPLLLAMALAIYIRQLGFAAEQTQIAVGTQADLLEMLIHRLSSPDHELNRRAVAERAGYELLAVEAWRQWLERASFESLRRSGRTTGRIDAAILRELGDGTIPNASVGEVRRLPFIQSARSGGADEPIEFVHPAFHEYLAACHLTSALADTDQTIGWPFGETLVNLGRDAFKYTLGRLLHRARTLTGPTSDAGLKMFFTLLDRDYGLQQYLYDAGFVDRSFDELSAAEDRLFGKSGYRCVAKLVGHKHYGSDGELAAGIAYMFQIVSAPETKGAVGPADRWYCIFCVDHIENRLAEVAAEDIAAQIAMLKGSGQAQVPESATEWADWTRNHWKALTNDRGIFVPVTSDGASGDADARSLATVPAPDWNAESMLVLRAAHYWGHVGNRILRAQASAPTTNLHAQRLEALQAYARAIVYRLVSLRLSLSMEFADAVLKELRDGIELPRWFHEWFPSDSLPDFERFVGPAQAIADTANQFSCRADILLWQTAHETDGDRRRATLGAAEAEDQVADRLWTLARSNRIKGFQGEHMIRYFLHRAGVSQRLTLARLDRRRLPSARHVEEATRHSIATLEREYGMHYERAWKDALRSTEAFREALERVANA